MYRAACYRHRIRYRCDHLPQDSNPGQLRSNAAHDTWGNSASPPAHRSHRTSKPGSMLHCQWHHARHLLGTDPHPILDETVPGICYTSATRLGCVHLTELRWAWHTRRFLGSRVALPPCKPRADRRNSSRDTCDSAANQVDKEGHWAPPALSTTCCTAAIRRRCGLRPQDTAPDPLRSSGVHDTWNSNATPPDPSKRRERMRGDRHHYQRYHARLLPDRSPARVRGETGLDTYCTNASLPDCCHR